MGWAKYFENANVKIQIDHHQVNEMFGDYNFVNPASPACAQNLIFIIEQLGVEIDKNVIKTIKQATRTQKIKSSYLFDLKK